MSAEDINCENHPDTPAIAKCETCKKRLCINCLLEVKVINGHRMMKLCEDCDAKNKEFQNAFFGKAMKKAKKKMLKKIKK